MLNKYRKENTMSLREKYASSTIENVEVSFQAPMFKVAEDTTFRIGFPLHTDKGTISLIPIKHFANKDATGQFYSIRVTEEIEADSSIMSMLTKELGQPKVRWATVVMVYDTTKDGKLTRPVTGNLMGVRLSRKDVQTLKALNASNKIAETDFYVTTDNAQMQAKQFTPILKNGVPNALWLNDKVSLIDDESDSDEIETKGAWHSKDIIDEAWDSIEKVTDSIARAYSISEVKEMFGAESAAKAGGDVEELDDDEWEEASTPQNYKPKTTAKKSKDDDDLEELD